MLQLAQMVVDMTKTGSSIVHRPLPVDDPQVRQPDITRAKRILDWEPKVDIRDGLKRTIEYFQEAHRVLY